MPAETDVSTVETPAEAGLDVTSALTEVSAPVAETTGPATEVTGVSAEAELNPAGAGAGVRVTGEPVAPSLGADILERSQHPSAKQRAGKTRVWSQVT